MWPLVRGLTTRDRDELLGMARRRSYRRNEVIFHEGDAADSVHFIEEGHVASRAFTEDGERVTYQLLGPGEVFGLLAVRAGPSLRNHGCSGSDRHAGDRCR
jgi:CRP-like cAMP-binding protein